MQPRKKLKLKISPKNTRIALDEETGDELLIFTGTHLGDWFEIIKKFNKSYYD